VTVRVAAVDIGTNSTRLLVADVDPAAGRVEELTRLTTVTRLGEGVDRNGRLLDEAIDRVAAACEAYRAEIDRLGAERTVAVLTSAVRDASNGEQLRELLAERFDFDARTISGEREARLTYLGATSGREQWSGRLLVIDIGGGSTEFVVGTHAAIDFHATTQIGSVRFTERHLHSDPPSPRELDACRADVRAAIAEAISPAILAGADDVVAVAGTPTSFAAIDQRLVPYDRSKVHCYRMLRATCDGILAQLAALPLRQRRKLPGLHPDRAPTIVAGGLILVESLEAFGLDAVEVSESDILDGAALEAAS
jgi:exopolyphosphatase/guanosine-5'-triphosphate,3'-diphosphate pyrophosphatase